MFSLGVTGANLTFGSESDRWPSGISPVQRPVDAVPLGERCRLSPGPLNTYSKNRLGRKWDQRFESAFLQRRVSTDYLQLELALPAFRAWRGAPEVIPFAVSIEHHEKMRARRRDRWTSCTPNYTQRTGVAASRRGQAGAGNSGDQGRTSRDQEFESLGFLSLDTPPGSGHKTRELTLKPAARSNAQRRARRSREAKGESAAN
jgi:hypothetical protein